MKRSFILGLLVASFALGCSDPEPPLPAPEPVVQPVPVPVICTWTHLALAEAGIAFDSYVMKRYILNTGRDCVQDRPVEKMLIREIEHPMYHSHAVNIVHTDDVYVAGFDDLVAYAKANPNLKDDRALIAPHACFRDKYKNVQCPLIRRFCMDRPGQKCTMHWDLDFQVMRPWKSQWGAKTRFLLVAL
jgi:hypothetical protein